MNLKDWIPKRLRPVVRSVYYYLWRLQIRVRCWYLDRSQPSGIDTDARLIPPAILRFKVGETASPGSFVSVGRATAQAIEGVLESVGRPFHTFQSVLDFGCGCGRTLIWFAEKYPEKALNGTDVDRASIEWCREHLTSAHFTLNSMLPPISCPDASFDLVYSISVFTHLSEDHQRRWLSELRRITKPNGILLFTVHGERSWNCLSPEEIETLRTAGFLFKTSSKLHGLVPDWYHTTFHSRKYVVETISPLFKLVLYAEGGLGYQDLVIAER